MLPVLWDLRKFATTKNPKHIIDLEVKKLESSFQIQQVIDLAPYDKDHAMAIAKSLS